MRKIAFILVLFSMSFFGCKECKDLEACNYGISESCKYSVDEDLLLTGTWNLVDIHDSNDICIFSFSSEFDCELDSEIESITLTFNGNKTCEVLTVPSEFSDPLDPGVWSINVCTNILYFDYISAVASPLPFGNQTIIQLSPNQSIFEDAEGNILRWEKI